MPFYYRIMMWQVKDLVHNTPHRNMTFRDVSEKKVKVKVASWGLSTLRPFGLLYSYPNKFPHSSPEAPRIIQMRGTSTSEGGNYYQWILLANPYFTKVLDSFTCRKSGTWDRFFYFPSEGRYTEDFPEARKIQRLRSGLNPRTRVPVASMLTTRPPKPSTSVKKAVVSPGMWMHYAFYHSVFLSQGSTYWPVLTN